MKNVLQIGNAIAFIITVVVNYLGGNGKLNGKSIGEISNELPSLFTPAGYAFSIWGLIYLMLLGFVIFQGRSLVYKTKNNDFILNIGYWFIISCLANSAWVLSWVYGYTGISCVCILILLVSLLKIVVANKMELWDAPITIIAFLWWPFVVYSGWVSVATIANIAAYLVKTEWTGFGIDPVIWTILLIVIATALNLIVTWTRNMREFALVGAWALFAIAYSNLDTYKTIGYVAIACGVLLVLSSSYHGYINRATNPFKKLKQYLNAID